MCGHQCPQETQIFFINAWNPRITTGLWQNLGRIHTWTVSKTHCSLPASEVLLADVLAFTPVGITWRIYLEAKLTSSLTKPTIIWRWWPPAASDMRPGAPPKSSRYVCTGTVQCLRWPLTVPIPSGNCTTSNDPSQPSYGCSMGQLNVLYFLYGKGRGNSNRIRYGHKYINTYVYIYIYIHIYIYIYIYTKLHWNIWTIWYDIWYDMIWCDNIWYVGLRLDSNMEYICATV